MTSAFAGPSGIISIKCSQKNERNFGGNNKKVELRTFTQKQYNFYNLLENTSQHNTRERHHVTYDITVGKLEKTQLKGWLLAEAKPSRCPFPEGWVDQIIDQRGSPPSQRMVTTVHCLKPDDAVKSYFTHRSKQTLMLRWENVLCVFSFLICYI